VVWVLRISSPLSYYIYRTTTVITLAVVGDAFYFRREAASRNQKIAAFRALRVESDIRFAIADINVSQFFRSYPVGLGKRRDGSRWGSEPITWIIFTFMVLFLGFFLFSLLKIFKS